MVKYQRKALYNQLKRSKDHHLTEEDEESCLEPLRLKSWNASNHRAKLKLFYFLVVGVVSCTLALAILFLSYNLCLLHAARVDEAVPNSATVVACSSVENGTICCDRSSHRSDVCVMKGDIRTHSSSSSIILYNANGLSKYVSGPSNDDEADIIINHEKVRPYTRKWEANVMETIDELSLVVKKKSSEVGHKCDVNHDVPGVFFSTGGYTGNLYHEFNDGILPLYITSQHLNKKVQFVILEYHDWWITKYGDILSQLSDFPPIDFARDKRVHCFPEVIAGLRIHDELSIDPSLMEGNRTIKGFHDVLDRAYWPRIKGLIEDEERQKSQQNSEEKMAIVGNPIKKATEKRKGSNKPKLVLISRNSSRAVTNEDSLVKMAEEIGFKVEVLKPQKTTELAKVYRLLNSSDVVIGVHGAAMTHFLFMNPGSVFIQITPLGTDWAAETYYGEPARKFCLNYIGYKILAKESSLYEEYDNNDPVLTDPSSVNHKGWEFTKKIYLDRQTIRLDLRRFRKRLLRAYYYTAARKNPRLRRLSQ